MDVLKQKRVTDNGDGRGYFRHCVEYPFKEKPEPGEELVETRGYGVSDTDPNLAYDQMYEVKKYYGKPKIIPLCILWFHSIIRFRMLKLLADIQSKSLLHSKVNIRC